MILLTILGTLLAVAGAALMAIAAFGLHRFDDPLTRLHIASKATSTGILLCLVGTGLASESFAVAVELALTGMFLLFTVPLATHALASAHHAQQRRIRPADSGRATRPPNTTASNTTASHPTAETP